LSSLQSSFPSSKSEETLWNLEQNYKAGDKYLVWYGYLFMSDIHFTHVVNILHRHVTQHFQFFPFNLSLHYLQNFGSGGMSDIHLKSVRHQGQSQKKVQTNI
jgi:hypothetical protein